MNNLFNQPDVSEIFERIEKLTPNSQRGWGKMNVSQMLAHCNVSVETAMGKNFIKRLFIGRIIGSLMKPGVLSEKPFGKNSPTDKTYIFTDRHDLDFNEEKTKLIKSINQFYECGVSKCTTHPHPFFGHFKPDDWAVFQWKHLDHHLRQFGV
ncbi:MAG: DUF1569 domain-containing protein [Ignavibacteriales bacterium]|nr:MAG: DUF1569 domain-containing protein [Ignavibacteriales bacterium]